RYEILAPGAGPKPTLGSTITAHYTGTFVDGKVFDSSVERGEPTAFPLNGVIEGWQEGLQLIGKAGRIKLYVPGNLAYGDTGRMNIPPAKALIFNVELIDVQAEQPQLAPLPPGGGPSAGPAPAPTP
ncbi:MAG: FKBP-type peptidyl-prolyl cis-trans isomerase, partial [Opitutaceae bacterium]